VERREAVKIFLDKVKEAYVQDIRRKGMSSSGRSEQMRQDIKENGNAQLLGVPYFYLLWDKKSPVGRKPSSKMPPVEAIIQWLKNKKTFNIEGDRTKGLKSLAWAIAKKIGKSGTDIHQRKRPALNVDDKIEDARKELASNLAKIGAEAIKKEADKLQNVPS